MGWRVGVGSWLGSSTSTALRAEYEYEGSPASNLKLQTLERLDRVSPHPVRRPVGSFPAEGVDDAAAAGVPGSDPGEEQSVEGDGSEGG